MIQLWLNILVFITGFFILVKGADTFIEYVHKIKEAQPEFVHKKNSSSKQIQDGINLDKDLLNRKNKINELIKVFHKDLSNTSEIYNYSDSSVIRHIKFIQND